MTAYLLDTHALLWLVNNPKRIPAATHALLADESNDLLVSAVTAWVITTKHRLGKLPEAEPLVCGWPEMIDRLLAIEVPLTPTQGFAAGRLVWQHGDPFDRMLAAQAIDMRVPLVSGDKVMATLPGLDVCW